jgi:COMPASS component SWD3
MLSDTGSNTGADGAVKVWDTGTGKLIHTFEGHLAGISTVAWSPDGETIASGSDDKSIRLWNVLTVGSAARMTVVRPLTSPQGKAHPIPFVGHHNYVYALAFSPKGNMIVSGSYDEAVFLWDVRSARVMRSLPAHSDPVAGVDVVRDGTLIVSCSTDGLIRVWDTATGQCLRTLVHDDNPPVTAVRFSPNGKFVLAWTLDNCVRLWNYVEGKCIKTYQGHVNRKYSLSGGFGVYGQPELKPEAFAVSGSEDGSLLCWDVVSKKVLQKIEGHTNAVLGVDTGSYDGKRYLVSCSLDRTVRVWEEIEVSDSQLNGIEEESTELGNPSPLPAQAQERATDGDRTPGDVMIE